MAERKTSAKKTVIAKPAEEVVEKVIAPVEAAAVVKETKNTKEQEKKIMVQQALGMVETRGLVAAIEASDEAGLAAAQKLGEIIATHVIPRPHTDVEKILPSLK